MAGATSTSTRARDSASTSRALFDQLRQKIAVSRLCLMRAEHPAARSHEIEHLGRARCRHALGSLGQPQPLGGHEALGELFSVAARHLLQGAQLCMARFVERRGGQLAGPSQQRAQPGRRRLLEERPRAREEALLERRVQCSIIRLGQQRFVPALARRQRLFGRNRDDRLQPRPQRAGDVCGDLRQLVRRAAVGFVEHAENFFARRRDGGQRRTLRRFGGLVDGEQPNHGVGFGDEAPGDLFVSGVDRVQPRRVDDVDALEHIERIENLHPANAPRLGVVEPAQQRRHILPGDLARGVVEVHDAPLLLAPILQDVDGRRRRHDAHRRHLLTEERVDERRLAGVELAHDGDEQRAIEHGRHARRFRSQLAELTCVDEQSMGALNQPVQIVRQPGGRGAQLGHSSRRSGIVGAQRGRPTQVDDGLGVVPVVVRDLGGGERGLDGLDLQRAPHCFVRTGDVALRQCAQRTGRPRVGLGVVSRSGGTVGQEQLCVTSRLRGQPRAE